MTTRENPSRARGEVLVHRAAQAALLKRLLSRLGPQGVKAALDEVIDAGGLQLTPAGYLRIKRAPKEPATPSAELALLLERRLYERGRLDAEAALLAALAALDDCASTPTPGGPAASPTRPAAPALAQSVALHVQPLIWPPNASNFYERHPQFCTRCGRPLTWDEFKTIQGVVRCSACRGG